MAKSPLTITLIWRNENYGSIFNAKAFRHQLDAEMSDSRATKLRRLFARHGFTFKENRASWIAESCPDNVPIGLVCALQEVGYTVDNVGCVPDVLVVEQVIDRVG